MSTQFITIDTAVFVSFPAGEAPEPAQGRSALNVNLLRDSDFFKRKSLADLAREQGVGPVKDIHVFGGGIPDDVDVDELLAQLEELAGS